MSQINIVFGVMDKNIEKLNQLIEVCKEFNFPTSNIEYEMKGLKKLKRQFKYELYHNPKNRLNSPLN